VGITGDVIYEAAWVRMTVGAWNILNGEALLTVSFILLVYEMEPELGRKTAGRRTRGLSPLGRYVPL
jgi:hypothetical protein